MSPPDAQLAKDDRLLRLTPLAESATAKAAYQICPPWAKTRASQGSLA